MPKPATELLAEIREAARHDLEAFELQSHLEEGEAPTEEELALIAQIRKLQEALILAINGYLDE